MPRSFFVLALELTPLTCIIMEKENLRDGKMCYCRRKTTNRRDDKAYIEIAVPDRLSHLLEKYAGEKRLFNFCETYG